MPKPEPMPKEAEDKILRALDRLADGVEAGDSPTGALVKAARALDLPPGHVRLAAHSYNIGRANLQRAAGEGLLGKTASVPLADAAAALAELYPDSPELPRDKARKEAVSWEYGLPPASVFELPLHPHKRAEAEEFKPQAPPLSPPGPSAVERGWDELRRLEHARGEARCALLSWKEKAAAALDAAYQALAAGGPSAPPFGAVRLHAEAALGGLGKAACDALAAGRPWLEKEGAWRPDARWPYDPAREPYASLAKLAFALGECRRARGELARLSGLPQERSLRERLAPGLFGKSAADEGGPRAPLTFLGGLSQGFKGTVAPAMAQLSRAAGLQDPSALGVGQLSGRDEAARKAYDELTDPAHEAGLDNVRLKAMLQDLMANDPVVSAHPPEAVADAFNEINQLAPNAARQPGVARALLRRYLSQGQVDTHDFDQLSSIEKNIAEGRLKAVEVGSKARQAFLPQGGGK